MAQAQDWVTELYKELAEKIKNSITGIEWVDLWHNQVGFLETEHPFPTPAIFMGFRSNNMQDLSQRVQKVNIQIDFYLYFETFADTFEGSYNQDTALNFLKAIGELNTLFHASVGNNYSSMKRTGFNPEETGNAGNLYRITYECASIDYTAFKEFDNGTFSEMTIEPFTIPG